MKLYRYLNEAKETLKQWNNYLSSNKMLAAGVKVLKKINKKGYRAYIVGGTVRDAVLGIEPHDVDIATNMPMSELDKMYKTYDIGKSKSFGIVIVKEGGFNFEVAQFRSESYVRPKYVRKILK